MTRRSLAVLVLMLVLVLGAGAYLLETLPPLMAVLTYDDRPPKYAHWMFAQCTVPGAETWGCEPGSPLARAYATWYLECVEAPWRGELSGRCSGGRHAAAW